MNDIDDTDESILFNNFIKLYEPISVFIGTSPYNEMTKYSGGHGEKWNGNNILMEIKSTTQDEHDYKFKYVLVGESITEFYTDEQIIKFVSSVGNNCVPYPYAQSDNNYYCLWQFIKIPIEKYPNVELEGYVSDFNILDNFPINKINVSERNSYTSRYPLSARKKTPFVRFRAPVNMQLIPNSCTDDSLPAVNQVNDSFR